MVSRWGGGQSGAKQAFYRQQGGPLWFGLPVSGITNSLVTLNVAADGLTLVTNASPGKILSAQVRWPSPPASSHCIDCLLMLSWSLVSCLLTSVIDVQFYFWVH